jgi:hypothetical protein
VVSERRKNQKEACLQYCDHGVSLEVVQGSSFKEDVGLVNQDNGLPRRRNVKHPLKRRVQLGRLRPQIASPNDVKGPLNMLARRLCRECLPHARRAKQVHDEPVPLSFDEVVESNFAVVRLDEGLKEVLPVGRKDEVGECIFIPVYVLNLLDVEFH